MKIKVFFQEDIIAIRVPNDITFQSLKDKLIERLKVNEDIVIQYKDEPTNNYMDMENGNMTRALARYNGSVGKRWYPDRVMGKLSSKWFRQ